MLAGRRAGALAVLLSCVATLAACGDDGGPVTEPGDDRDPAFAGGGVAKTARCPAEAPGCRVATGRIVYVERVDPDGDGDAHFVILDPPGITLPGLTAIDVRRGLRPEPLPGVGDPISAAGPVQEGSYGQRQIHAIELNVAGRGN